MTEEDKTIPQAERDKIEAGHMEKKGKGPKKKEATHSEEHKAGSQKEEKTPVGDASPPIGSKPIPGDDDNIINALAHSMIVLLPMLFPVFVPLVIWLAYKDKSPNVKFQSLQAFIFQFIIAGVFIFCWVTGSILGFLVLPLLLIPLAFLIWTVAVVYGLYGAYKTFIREDFSYIMLGDMVKKGS